MRLAVAGAAHAEAAAAQRVEVVGVVRLAELEHHVVADVDDVVDRAHARQRSGGARSSRATRSTRTPLITRAGEPRAPLAVDELDGRLAGRRAGGGQLGAGQRRTITPKSRCEVAGHADVADSSRAGCG